MKKLFLIISLSTLAFTACPPPEPEPQPEPEKPTLSKIDITDAAALFVEPSGTDAGKIFKIKKDLATIEEVKYTNTDGSSADMGNLKASYVINAHNDYAIIGFAADPNKAKTYDFELIADKAYLVRKSDGKVFALDEVPSCNAVMASEKYIYYPAGEIGETETENEIIYTTYGDKLVRLSVANDICSENILPSEIKQISRFFIDKNENVWFSSPSVEILPIITENKEYLQLETSVIFINSPFQMILDAGYFFYVFDNQNFDLDTSLQLSNMEEFSKQISEAPNLQWGGYSNDISSTTPLLCYEQNNESVSLFTTHLIVYTQKDSQISGKLIQYNDAVQSLYSAGEDKIIFLTDDQIFSYDLITKEIQSSSSSTIFNSTQILHSMINRNKFVLISVFNGDENFILRTDTNGAVTTKLKSTYGKVNLVDMEYSSWCPLPYRNDVG